MERTLLRIVFCLAAVLLFTGSAAFGDTTAPRIVRVAVSHHVISEEHAGQSFVITLGFSEPVTGTGPTLAFSPNLDSLLSPSSMSWIDSETFETTYAIGTVAGCLLGVDIIIDGALEDGDGNHVDLPAKVRNVFSVDGMVVATPAGAVEGSFLDCEIILAEGEDPPVVGYRRLMAEYTIGEPITGAVLLSSCAGRPLDDVSLIVELSALDLSSRPYSSEQVVYTRVSYDRSAGKHQFAVDTTELASGYYDLRLAFPDSTYVRLRIELTNPAP